MSTSPPELQAVGIHKYFVAVRAVDDVSLHLPPGTFHALLGENGAGKSTLVKCLMGFYQADSGEILIDGQSVSLRSPRDARRAGIGMVFQHFTLISSMTVAENLVLARPDLPLVIDWKAEIERLTRFLTQAPFQVDLHAQVSMLSAGQKQKVEILKELYLETRLLILDEPTSVLTPQEASEVLGYLRRLVDQGQLSILIITHKFREVMGFCDHVTVMRRGRFAGAGRVSELTPAIMAEMMMGEARTASTVRKSEAERGRPLFRISGLRADGDLGLEALHDLSLTVHAGEIVGIAGVSGNGQRELVQVIAGQRPRTSGEITVGGEVHLPTRKLLKKHRFYTLPEEPLQNASVARLSVAENMALRLFDEPPFRKTLMRLDRSAIAKFAAEMTSRYSVRPANPSLPIADLSGGNVQRAVLARELSSGKVDVLVAANPCFGLDFKAVDFIHDRLIEARNSGAAVLLISEDLDELLELADRILVISEGRLVHEAEASDADVALLGTHMAGTPQTEQNLPKI